MKELIIANWKMNPSTYAEAERLFKSVLKKVRGVKNAEIVICPPFVWLTDISHKYKKEINFGAQDVFLAAPKGRASPSRAGRETICIGEASPRQLKSLGVKYVIIGHSERRALGETDEIINKKAKETLKIGLKVVLCVGEPLSVRRKGRVAAGRFVKNQIRRDLKSISKIKNLLIAYEPIWAIGTGRADKPEDALEMARFIKESLVISHKSKVRVLYGGSVNSKNARAFLSPEEINGALVGKESLKASDFQKIVQSAI
ncbi:MAG: triose-phosphate isomerase [Candidatus Jorgensenbacteria bacterium]